MTDDPCHRIHCAFLGVRVLFQTNDIDLAEALRRDFSHFATPPFGAAEVWICAFRAEPPWRAAPDARCVMIQPSCVVYQAGRERWVDYQGRALCRFNAHDERGEVWSTDFDLLHEITYLLCLSRVGELHDRRGIHRIHALGLSLRGRGVVCLFPSGGGKTRLGLRALRRPDVQLLSDDTPLVTRTGDLLGFPIRIGIGDKAQAQVPERFVQPFRRREHGMKWLVDIEAFAGQVAKEATPSAVVLGVRKLNGASNIRSVPKAEVAPELLRGLVAGVGLPQVVEYFLRFDVRDIKEKAPIVGSRLLAGAALLARARTYRFEVGRDAEESGQVFERFLDSLE